MTKILSVLSTALVRKFIAHSELENLEQVVLSGHGHKLIGETAADSQIRAFIRATPTYLVSSALVTCIFRLAASYGGFHLLRPRPPRGVEKLAQFFSAH